MSNKISYIFEVQDRMSKELQQMSRNFKEMASSMRNNGNSIRRTLKDIPTWTGLYLQQAQQDMRKFSQKMQTFSTKMYGAGRKGLFAGVPTGIFAKSSYGEFAKFEQLNTQMTVAFQGNAEKMTQAGIKWARSTALDTKQVFSLMASLKQTVGMETDAIMPFVQNYTKALYGFGAGENFEHITRQIKEGLSKGKLELMDIKIIEAWGLPIKKMLADTLEVTTRDVMDMISEKGGAGITPQMLQDTMQKFALDERFANSVDKYAQSAAGVQDQFREAFTLFKVSFGKVLHTTGLTQTLRSITGMLDGLREKIDALSPLGKKFLGYFTLLVITIPPILIGLGLISSIIGVAVGGMALLLSPFVAIPIAIVAIVGTFYIFRKSIAKGIRAIGQFLMKFKAVQLFVRYIVWYAKSIKNIFFGVISVIKTIGNIISTIISGITKGIDYIADKITAFLSKFDTIRNIAGKAGDFFSGSEEPARLQRPQSQMVAKKDILTEMIVNGNINQNQSSKADVSINFGNLPQNATVQTRQQSKGANFLNLGVNSVSMGI